MKKISTLSQLGQSLLGKAINLYDKGQYIDSYNLLKLVDFKEITKQNKTDVKKFANLFYVIGKLELSKKNYSEALDMFKKAHELNIKDELISQRITLLQNLVKNTHNEIKRELDYSSFCEKLGVISQKCRKESKFSYIKHLTCLNIISPTKFNLLIDEKSVDVLFLGYYHPYKKDDKWSNIIRQFKNDYDKLFVLALSKVLSEYLFNNSDIMKDIDLIVPVPPNPQKYANRGYAPTDLLEECLSQESSIPSCRGLMRKTGCDTRSSTKDELEKYYFIEEKYKNVVQGMNILLLDDVSTRVYTLSVCGHLLFKTGVSKVSCMTLAKTGG